MGRSITFGFPKNTASQDELACVHLFDQISFLGRTTWDYNRDCSIFRWQQADLKISYLDGDIHNRYDKYVISRAFLRLNADRMSIFGITYHELRLDRSRWKPKTTEVYYFVVRASSHRAIDRLCVMARISL